MEIMTYIQAHWIQWLFALISAAAAISQLPVHTAVLLTNDGRLLEYHAYKHAENEEE